MVGMEIERYSRSIARVKRYIVYVIQYVRLELELERDAGIRINRTEHSDRDEQQVTGELRRLT